MCLVRSTYFHLLRMARDCRQAMPATIQFAHFDSLNRLHRNKRCRIGEGSCQLHEENALPTINLIQKSFNIFHHVISSMFPHDFTRFSDAFWTPDDVAGCGAPVASGAACDNGTAPSPNRGQPRDVRGLAPGDEDEELRGEKPKKKPQD